MADEKPTSAQAELLLQLYDLRREAKLRQARDWFARNFFPATAEDLQRLAPPGTEENAFMRMVASYWEQACLLLRYGLLHEELLFQSSGEFFMVWERVKPIAPAYRQMLRNPHMFSNLEAAAQRYEQWAEQRAPGSIEALRQMWQQVRRAATAG